MKINEKEVRRIADLAHLHLTADEVARMQVEMTGILDYIDQLSRVDVSAVPDVSQTGATPMRDDVERPSVAQDAVAGNAPSFENGFFVVPRVIGE